MNHFCKMDVFIGQKAQLLPEVEPTRVMVVLQSFGSPNDKSGVINHVLSVFFNN